MVLSEQKPPQKNFKNEREIQPKRRCARVAGLCRVLNGEGQSERRGRAAAQLLRADQFWQKRA